MSNDYISAVTDLATSSMKWVQTEGSYASNFVKTDIARNLGLGGLVVGFTYASLGNYGKGYTKKTIGILYDGAKITVNIFALARLFGKNDPTLAIVCFVTQGTIFSIGKILACYSPTKSKNELENELLAQQVIFLANASETLLDQKDALTLQINGRARVEADATDDGIEIPAVVGLAQQITGLTNERNALTLQINGRARVEADATDDGIEIPAVVGLTQQVTDLTNERNALTLQINGRAQVLGEAPEEGGERPVLQPAVVGLAQRVDHLTVENTNLKRIISGNPADLNDNTVAGSLRHRINQHERHSNTLREELTTITEEKNVAEEKVNNIHTLIERGIAQMQFTVEESIKNEMLNNLINGIFAKSIENQRDLMARFGKEAIERIKNQAKRETEEALNETIANLQGQIEILQTPPLAEEEETEEDDTDTTE